MVVSRWRRRGRSDPAVDGLLHGGGLASRRRRTTTCRGRRRAPVSIRRTWKQTELPLYFRFRYTNLRYGLTATQSHSQFFDVAWRLNCSHAPSQIDYISVCSIASWLSLQPWSRLDYNVVMTFGFNNNNNNNVYPFTYCSGVTNKSRHDRQQMPVW